MKIVTWNINGIRATKQSLKQLMESSDADVICLQETKITKDQLESEIALIDGYNSYFSFCQTRTGYSGVATYCKESATPVLAQTGLSENHEKDAGASKIGCYGNLSTMFTQDRLQELDKEGRTVITQHEIAEVNSKLTIINVYCPRADPEKEERKFFKLDFYKALEERAKSLILNGSFVLIVGDINTSHKPIDHCDPSDPILFYDNLARVWLDSFIYNNGDYSNLHDRASVTSDTHESNGMFVDSFRYFYPKKREMFTCWCTSNRARQTNYGTRIDYIFSDINLVRKLKSCEIMTDFTGSDHCPVEASIDVNIIQSKICPQLCTRFMTEFGGKQQKLSSYFAKKFENNSMVNNVSFKKRPSDESESLSQKRKKQRKNASQTTLTNFVKIAADKNKKTSTETAKPSKTEKKQLMLPSITTDSINDASLFWKKLLKGPPPPPLCTGHREATVLRTVKKEGPNVGRQFYCCARPEGHRSNPDANCQYFKWVEKSK